jgi:alpha-aminoadipic semialdehyde synthase
MRKNLCVGILRETKGWESRAPLTPQDVHWLVKKGVKVEVESSPVRIFKDKEYEKNGAKIVKKFRNASLLLGIKEPKIEDLYFNKIYMIFSHTIKGQFQNIPLLIAFSGSKSTLIDYEKIADSHGRRLVYFGRFAGICGAVDSLHYLGKRLQWKGIKNPFTLLKPTYEYNSLKAVKQAVAEIGNRLRKGGLSKNLSPFVVGITGHGNVSNGAQEILNVLNPMEVHPKDMPRFITHQKGMRNKIYKIVFFREEKFRSKNGRGFYFEEYLKNPERFESNLDKYLQYLNILIHTSYWDKLYPKLVTKNIIHRLAKKKPFRLEFISDISCDVNGAIELTYKTTTPDNPVFTYDPRKKSFIDGYRTPGITVLAIDNLPSELPRDASYEFSSLIRDYVYQIAAHGVKNVTQHTALPAEIRRAAVLEDGRLTKNFKYLRKFLSLKGKLAILQAREKERVSIRR